MMRQPTPKFFLQLCLPLILLLEVVLLPLLSFVLLLLVLLSVIARRCPPEGNMVPRETLHGWTPPWSWVAP